MHTPTLLRDRPRTVQIVLGGLVPFAFGAVVGVVLGVSTGVYWALAVLAGIGAVLAGFEHQDGWGGADRGLVGGALFGLGVLLAHWIAGTHAKVSLGSFPPLLIVVDAIAGMLLGALGGRVARGMREREQEQAVVKAA
jgi:apolipoprotein N-acyltransferase